MDIAIFTPSRPADEFNDLPASSERRSVFWSFLQPVLNLPTERFEPVHNGGVSREIAEIREYERRRAEANNATPPTVSIGDLASEAVMHVAETIKRVPALKWAIAFLTHVLDAGPVSEKRVAELASLEGISEKTLKRARAKLKVKATKKGQRGGWFLSMTRAKEASDS